MERPSGGKASLAISLGHFSMPQLTIHEDNTGVWSSLRDTSPERCNPVSCMLGDWLSKGPTTPLLEICMQSR